MQEAIKRIEKEIERLYKADDFTRGHSEIDDMYEYGVISGQIEGLQRAIEILKEVQNEQDNQKD